MATKTTAAAKAAAEKAAPADPKAPDANAEIKSPAADDIVKAGSTATSTSTDSPVGDTPTADDATTVPPQKKPAAGNNPVTKPPVAKAAVPNKFQQTADFYARHYPDAECFHITSDMQVFLPADRSEAVHHQADIDPKKQVTTIKVN